jgi:predicted glycoside hydrolase/deacetylase ChbG (UPF0249 family)
MLLVNADDFGKNEEINRAVCEAFEKGYINSATLMTNMPGAHEAYKLAKDNGFADRVGIHLNITEGMPLTEGIRNNPLICSSDGSFNAAFYHNTKYRLYMDRQSIDRIKEELDAQIGLFLEMGFTLLHIDSHHHVHTNYPVYRALKELGVKYDYEYIRLSRNLYKGGNPVNGIYKGLYNANVKRLARHTSSYFGDYRDLMGYFGLDPARTTDRMRSSSGQTDVFFEKNDVEIMVHPMYDNSGKLTDTDIPMDEQNIIHSCH